MGALRRILGVLRKSADGDPLSDAELLARFAASRDQAAFEVLVWRHSAMVFGVCRRALRDEHLAEDAFQAVFLVLARKAGSVRGANLAGWLFRVSRRVASRAAKRVVVGAAITTEPPCPVEPDPLERDELRSVLDAEIARLPERLRRPVLLCYLGGLTTEDAARQLAIPRGTVLSRLATARQRLAARLTRRGVTVPAVALSATSAAVVSATVRQAVAFAARTTTPLHHPVILAEGVLSAMRIARIVPAAAACLLVVGLASGFGLRAGSAHVPTEPLQAEKPSEPPKKLTAIEAAVAENRARVRSLASVAARLQEQIAAEEQKLRRDQISAGMSPDNLARLDRQLALLDAEVFASERLITEQEVQLKLLKERLQTGRIPPNPTADAESARRVAADPQVIAAQERLASHQKAIDAAQVVGGAGNVPNALTDALKRAEVDLSRIRRDALDTATAAVARESTKRFAAQVEEAEDQLFKTQHVHESRKLLRNALLAERERMAPADRTTQIDAARDAIKPKKEVLQRLRSEIVRLETELDLAHPLPQSAAPVGIEAKLDVLIREVEGLRRDVRELKKR